MNHERPENEAVAGRGAAEGEPSAFKREVSGVSRNEPEHAKRDNAEAEHATRDAEAHVPVLLDEVAFLLAPRHGGWVVDGTVGLGGHAERLLEGADDTRLFGIDRDPEALARAARRLARFGARVILERGSFRHLAALAARAGVEHAAAVLLDLGLSSYQLDESGRGFSFQGEEPLDMRFDPEAGVTAAELLARLSAEEIASLLSELGEERHARRIARVLVEQRRRAPLRTAADLVSVVKRAVPRAAWSRRTHVATRTFQAVRMAVNDEPGALAEALPQAAALLAVGGRLGVISFHSGEDRVVKHAFRGLAGRGFVELEPAPVVAGREETTYNPRARSAKLRVLARQEAA
jgi:16S rRNA (cytosine1402-N4)-methyltransferase